jgi:DNA-binding protein HU-beta
MKNLVVIIAGALLTVCLSNLSAFAASANPVIVEIAKEAGITPDQAQKNFDLIFTAIKSELQAGRDVKIMNFGHFTVLERKAHQARNPKTGAAIEVPDRKYPHFVTSDTYKDAFNGKSKAAPATSKEAAQAPAA